MRIVNVLYNKFYKSLQVRIIVIIVIFMFIPVIYLFNYNFSHSEKMLLQKTSDLILDNLQQIGNQIENVCLDIIKISNVISSDNTILSALAQDDGEKSAHAAERPRDFFNLTSEEKIKISRIEKQLDYLKSSIFFNYNADVMLIGSDGIIYSAMNREDELKLKTEYMKRYSKQEWYANLVYGNLSIVWIAPFSYNVDVPDDNSRYISAVRTIRNDSLRKTPDIIMVNVSEEYFHKIISNRVNGTVMLINNEKDTIFSSEYENSMDGLNMADIFASIPDNNKGYTFTQIGSEKFMVNYYPLNRIGWNLISIIHYDNVTSEIQELKTKSYTINTAAFFLFLVIAVLLILHITNPLKKLIDRIRRMKVGEHIVGLQTDNYPDDVSGIVGSFDYLFKRIEALVKKVIDEQRREYELTYEALRAQITPHFLFNTLETIKWSAIMSGKSSVSRMISALGKLLEASMGKGEEEISFKEEIELVEAYVFIQNARYNDKFVLNVEMDESVQNLKVLKMILQPLVENSIIHGLRNKDGEGVISIKAERHESTVRVCVADNGEGIGSEKLQQILTNSIDDVRSQKFSGIGLININERLKMKYGKEYGLSISSEYGQGTSVTVTLPVME